MWNFTEDGFVSVVKYVPSHDSRKNGLHYKVATDEPDEEWLILRARIKGDIQRVADALTEGELASIHYDHNPHADYSHRALVTKKQYTEYMVGLIEKIDYDSHFKEVTRDRAPACAGRYGAMMSVWSAFAALQDTTPYSGVARNKTTTDKKSSSSGSGYGSLSYNDHDQYDNFESSTGFPWSRNTSNPPSFATKSTPDLDMPTLLDQYIDPAEMAQLLTEWAPADVPQVKIDNASDEAFELWLAAVDYAESSGFTSVSLNKESVQEIADDIGIAIVDDTEEVDI